jgi:hypothetical protein
MRADRIFRVYRAKNPTSTMEVHHGGPALLRPLALGSEGANLDVGAISLPAADREVLDASHGKLRPAAEDQSAARSRGGHWLKLDLLEVDEVFVVEFDVVRVQSVLDGVVKGVWRLRSSSGCGGSHEGLWNVG